MKKISICKVFINLKDNEKPIVNNYNHHYSINHTQHYIYYPKQLINYNPNQSYNYTIKAWTCNMNYLGTSRQGIRILIFNFHKKNITHIISTLMEKKVYM